MLRAKCIVFAALACLPLSAQTVPTEPSWLGLYNFDLLAWLENQNRLAELCTGREGSTEWQECREAKMKPKAHLITVRSGPSAEAAVVGTIVLIALPGQGLSAFVSSGGAAEPLTPDLFDNDWGYGPHFHQTILGRQGTWFRIPLDPLPIAWVNSGEWTRDVDVRMVNEGDILRTPRGDMVVLGTENGALRMRPEQDADMWCEAGAPPPLRPWTEIRVPFQELYNDKGHLLLATKYMRGC